MHLSRLRVQGLRATALGDLEVNFPGRFSVLIGANGAGKTTVSEALYLSHHKTFPNVQPPSASTLGPPERTVEVDYSFASEGLVEGPLGASLQAQSGRNAPGTLAASWSRTLRRNLGRVRAETIVGDQAEDAFLLVYLPASRNPLDELARREARILVELLRAQQQNRGRGRDLTSLRSRASVLLEQLATDGLLTGLEDRVGEHLRALSAGVSRNWPYIRGQVVDDRYLARVLELMLATIEGREHALPLEAVGLGYVNLLHIAVTLAAIPDSRPAESAGDQQEEPEQSTELENAEERLRQAQAESESREDSFFPDGPFHVTLVIEEPEAHLHPQLQHSFTRYLRREVQRRPELQVILSTHATDVITSCDPEEIVVVRRDRSGRNLSRTIAALPITDREDVLRKTRLHLDASRSAALFAERLLLVEGVTEAAVIREFGWIWAGDDPDKQAFVDALSIVAMGTKVGAWAVRLLATRNHELCNRIAVLRDTDLAFDQTPSQPAWADEHDPDVVLIAQSHPTLEPELTDGNEALVADALSELDGLDVPAQVTAESVHELFRSARKPKDAPATPAGPAARRKGEFALALAGQLRDARTTGTAVRVPEPIEKVLDFLYMTADSDITVGS
ncbi:ATP-dependent nuclease [Kribbella solani]|uniref:Putative ATP-dependent endonuclease of OLD family n=1 Tax=Kribbella solani TaxID=236067 RepID=A0A841DSH5_9ACTN|nr:AAA family ATPase [Kribbella solani]MBB5979845.1 putative ATP-dependent endonuclease of OLD family [Kribbella solani]